MQEKGPRVGLAASKRLATRSLLSRDQGRAQRVRCRQERTRWYRWFESRDWPREYSTVLGTRAGKHDHVRTGKGKEMHKGTYRYGIRSRGPHPRPSTTFPPWHTQFAVEGKTTPRSGGESGVRQGPRGRRNDQHRIAHCAALTRKEYPESINQASENQKGCTRTRQGPLARKGVQCMQVACARVQRRPQRVCVTPEAKSAMLRDSNHTVMLRNASG